MAFKVKADVLIKSLISLNSLVFLSFFLISCEKIKQKRVVIKAGLSQWTFEEVQEYFRFRLKESSLQNKTAKDLKKEILNEILLRSLVENWAKKKKLKVQLPALNKEDEKAFLKFGLKRQALKDHKNYVALYELLLKDFFNAIPKPPLKRQKSFYNQHKARFKTPASCDLKQIVLETKNLAQSLVERLKQGENFEKLHQLHSIKQHPGWIRQGDLDIFDKACFSTKLPAVLKSAYGYHIFKVQKKSPAQQKSFLAVQPLIIKILKQKEAKKQFSVWLKQETLKTSLFIDKKLLEKIHIQYKTN